MLEGTGVYFLLLFLVFLIVYIVVKICLGNILKRMGRKSWEGYIPFYTTFVLVKELNLKSSIFYLSLIPIVNLYYYYIIINELLKAFGLRENAILYIVIPMYKFPYLVYLNPKYKLNEEVVSEFAQTQSMLFEQNETIEEININPSNNNEQTVFNDNNMQPDETKMTYVEAKEEEKKEKPLVVPLDERRPQMCPNCGAKLAPSATACFLCGYKIGGQ